MDGEPAGRSGLVVIRMWREAGSCPGSGIRARVTSTMDLESSRTSTAVAATVEGILEVVRSQIQSFASEVRGGLGEPGP
jgi:hypothetical protein